MATRDRINLTETASYLVGKECARIEHQWGTQRHGARWWLAILTEEVGEVAAEVAQARIDNWSPDRYRNELVQVAAVAMMALESLLDGSDLP